MQRQVFGATNTGLVRTTNQDKFCCEVLHDSIGCAVVCDGMGGENGGNIASDIAMEFAKKVLSRDLSKEMTELSMRAVFSSIFSAANALIYEAAQKEKALKGMGTTMIIAVHKEQTLFVGAVGDSRVYITGPQRQQQITKDHTVVQMMIDIGELTVEDAEHHPKRHYITRAVGVAETVDMDFIVEALDSDEIALLCSDGLYSYFEGVDIYDMLSQSVAAGSADNLINLALDGGGSDNVTAVVMV